VSQENESFLLDMTEITVKHGHNSQFIAGVEAWKACYLENDGENNWNIWKRVQGVGTVYTMTGRMANWAEMDEEGSAAGKACRMLVVNLIMPHVESIHYNIARSMPAMSSTNPFPADTELVWVYNVKVNNSTSFKEVLADVNSALSKSSEGVRGYWYSVIGGAPEVSDYFVSIPYKNFAGLDVDREGVWEIHEKANGKKKTDAVRAKFRAAVDSDWSYIYSLQKELSN
jgi:hypothetical protein